MIWNSDSVAKLDDKKLHSLRQNALRKAETGITALCDAELAARSENKQKVRQVRIASSKSEAPVIGFHFVCKKEKGVTRNADVTVWTGTWVVAKKHAEQALKTGAYVALHGARSELSYLQGTVKGWRQAPRERRYGSEDAKTTSGIDFLIEPTNQPLEWVGEATAEKGYAKEAPR